MDVSPEKAQQVLSLVLPPQSDFGAVTLRQGLIRLLSEMWDDPENFSGYRPLGSSDWPDQIIESVVNAGLALNDGEAKQVVSRSIAYLSE